jgi:hypothetical protein
MKDKLLRTTLPMHMAWCTYLLVLVQTKSSVFKELKKNNLHANIINSLSRRKKNSIESRPENVYFADALGIAAAATTQRLSHNFVVFAKSFTIYFADSPLMLLI